VSDAKTVLLIDSHDQDRQHYASRLKASSSNYTIIEAVSGQAGLDLYNSQPIDCVILELGLPDLSGFEVLAKIIPVTKHPQLPVIVLTVFSNQALLTVAKMDGACATLHKGNTSADDLVKIVHDAISTVPVDDPSHFDHA
jgi:DNA-binding NarL/FixJ family response regulator